uniref:Folate-binding protein YgfZ n=1 Tax=Cyanothece sp. (strain PCC 7425 / ATCC 29141) TaxID=395961 RepID=B8HYA0_CYAP4
MEATQSWQAAHTGVALYDCTPWGRIQVTNSDRLAFLHNQSTNEFKLLKPGQGCDTVIVNSTARTLDLVTAYVTEDAVILLVSPQKRDFLLKWLDRYIFFGDKVKLTDITAVTAAFSLIGPQSSALLTELGVETSTLGRYGDHLLCELAGMPVRVVLGSGLALPGYTLLTDAEHAGNLNDQLIAAGAISLDETAWQQLRLHQGRPQADAELTEDYNPLEAGLWHTISFNKGCYIGQETIARLNTYQGVKQQLWGIQLSTLVAAGTTITQEGNKIGLLTSAILTPEGPFGLGYVKTKAGGAGLAVEIGDATGELVEVPFLTRGIAPA